MKAEESKTNHWNKNSNWIEELELLKSIIDKTELQEAVKWGGIVYVLNGKNVLGIGGFKNYFTIWFFNGVFLKDEKQVLVNAQEGVTKSLRQWRFNSKEEINETLILAYIREAIENEKLGKSIKPQKKEFTIPAALQKAFDEHPALAEAFQKFTLYKQNDFIEHIATAKREDTVMSRIEKIKPLIMAGIGLNDKYK